MYKPQQHSPETAFMSTFTGYTPYMLIGVTLTTYLLVGAMQFSFYSKAFENSASTLDWVFGISIALICQAARFALLITAANHFAHGRNGKGAFSVVSDIVITAIASYEMSHLAEVWAIQNPTYANAIPLIVQVIIWLGPLLQIHLLTSVAGSASDFDEPQQATEKQQNQTSQNGYHEQEDFYQGNGARH